MALRLRSGHSESIESMTIGILGSSFDPPHKGHLAIARLLLKSKKIDKVLLMPVHVHPFEKKLSAPKDRLAMTKLLEEKNISVSTIELNKKGISYSIETLRKLKKHFPKDQFYWILGSDQLNSLPEWKDWQEIINDFGVIVVARDNPISSSEIKKRIKEGKSIAGMVPKKVEKYIIQNGLYR